MTITPQAFSFTKILCLGFILFFTSCKDSEEVKDTINPSIEASFQSTEDYLRGDAVLDIAGSDDLEIKLIEVFIDGDLWKTVELNTSSYNGTLTWNTTEVKDGVHPIKIVITDKGGNTSVQEWDVTVYNYLIRYHFFAKGIPAGSERWIFLSDDDGKTLGVEKAENNSVVTFPVPEGFDQDHVTVNSVEYYPGPYFLRSMSTFINVSLGDYNWSDAFTGNLEEASLKIVINDVPESYQYYLSLQQNSSTRTGNTITITAKYYPGNTDDVLISLYDGAALTEKYILLKSVAVNTEVNLSFSEFKTFTRTSFTISGEDLVNSFQGGSLDDTFNEELPIKRYDGDFNDHDPSVIKWAKIDEIPYYSSSLYLRQGTTDFSYVKQSKDFPTEMKKLDVEITKKDFDGDDIILKTVGKYDFKHTQFIKFTTNEVGYDLNVWSFTFGEGDVSFKKPEIPIEILSIGRMVPLNNIPLSSINFVENSNLTFTDPYHQVVELSDNMEYLQKQIFFDNFGLPEGRSYSENNVISSFLKKNRRLQKDLLQSFSNRK